MLENQVKVCMYYSVLVLGSILKFIEIGLTNPLIQPYKQLDT